MEGSFPARDEDVRRIHAPPDGGDRPRRGRLGSARRSAGPIPGSAVLRACGPSPLLRRYASVLPAFSRTSRSTSRSAPARRPRSRSWASGRSDCWRVGAPFSPRVALALRPRLVALLAATLAVGAPRRDGLRDPARRGPARVPGVRAGPPLQARRVAISAAAWILWFCSPSPPSPGARGPRSRAYVNFGVAPSGVGIVTRVLRPHGDDGPDGPGFSSSAALVLLATGFGMERGAGASSAGMREG